MTAPLAPDRSFLARLRGLVDVGQAGEALAELLVAEADWQEDADYWLLRGAALGRMARTAEALTCFRNALGVDPNHEMALFNAAESLRFLGERGESLALMRDGQRRFPEHAFWLERMWWSERTLCIWRDREAALRRTMTALAENPAASGDPDPFSMLLLGLPEPVQLALARRRARAEERQVAHYRVVRAAPRTEQGDRPLRIGWLSADFHEHATMRLLLEVLEKLDHSRFRSFFYSFGPDLRDAFRARVRACGEFVDITALGAGEAAARIAADAIDILVDLKGYTAFARPAILALRPAAIQVQWLGYPGSMGADWIDWIFADPVVLPDATPEAGAPGYAERVLYLPDGYQPNGGIRCLPSKPARRLLGLPEKAVVLASFNAPYKLDAACFDLWLEVLRAAPDAVLWLLAEGNSIRDNLCRRAELAGVDPGRLIFAPKVDHASHLRRMQQIDLALDTFAMGGHTTTSDLLRVGVPVLALAGRTFGRRVAASLLHHAGLGRLVFETPVALRDAAIRLACDRRKLDALRRRVEVARLLAPTFDAPRLALGLGGALSTAWTAFVSGDARRCLSVPEVGEPLPDQLSDPPRPLPERVRGLALEIREALEAGELERAWRLALALLSLRPLDANALAALGYVRYRQERHHEAVLLFQQAMLSHGRPDAQTLHNMASALESAGLWDAAERDYRDALALAPERADTLTQLGCLLRNLGRAEEAVTLHARALALRPDDAQAVYVYGGSLYQAGRMEAAMTELRRAVAMNPDLHEARSNLGICHLLRGEFAAGWDEFEWRWRSPQMQGSWAPFPAPAWGGDDLGNRILMVWAEQGLGDNIQFVRYLGVLRERFPQAGLVFWGPRAMGRLCERFFQRHGVTFMAREQAPNPARVTGMDCHVPVMGLPRLSGTRLDSIPSTVPGYLDLAPEWVDGWRARLDALAAPGARRLLNVGVVWSGQREGLIVEKRNIHPRVLEPWLDVPGIRWFSLQVGAEQAAQVAGTRWEGSLIDWTAEIVDFADTASLARALDLVISVDTSTVHAAAAAGASVWMLSRFDGCWRWLQGRGDSPWYPRLKIFSQPVPRDWSAPVAEVATALRALS